jgi:phosphoribulokinase
MPHQKTILLGVVGDSAAGKTTLSAGIARILGEDRVTVICTDDYHRYNRKQRSETGISALDPNCNYINIMEQHFDLLRRGHPILKPIYNHSTGDFDPPEYIEPREFVILEGLLGYHSKAMRQNFDVKVYLAPEEELRIRWKIKRDMAKRGYTEEEVRASLAKRVNDSKNFIEPQKVKADIVVNFHRSPRRSEEISNNLDVRLVLRPTLPHPDLTDVVSEVRESDIIDKSTIAPEKRYYLHVDDLEDDPSRIISVISREKGRLTEKLHISGQIGNDRTAQIEDIIWGHLPDLQHLRPEEMGQYQDGSQNSRSNSLALTQLLITYHMLVAMQELKEDMKMRVV